MAFLELNYQGNLIGTEYHIWCYHFRAKDLINIHWLCLKMKEYDVYQHTMVFVHHIDFLLWVFTIQNNNYKNNPNGFLIVHCL